MIEHRTRPTARNASSPEERDARDMGGRDRIVPGFFNDVAAATVERVGDTQPTAGIDGRVAEIGVFAGRNTTLRTSSQHLLNASSPSIFPGADGAPGASAKRANGLRVVHLHCEEVLHGA